MMTFVTADVSYYRLPCSLFGLRGSRWQEPLSSPELSSIIYSEVGLFRRNLSMNQRHVEIEFLITPIFWNALVTQCAWKEFGDGQTEDDLSLRLVFVVQASRLDSWSSSSSLICISRLEHSLRLFDIPFTSPEPIQHVIWVFLFGPSNTNFLSLVVDSI